MSIAERTIRLDHSVTKAFYDRGWRGINIEPIPSLLQEFVVQRPLDANLAIAISDGSDGAEFYEIAGTGLSTLFHAIAQQHTKAGLSTRVIKSTDYDAVRCSTSVCSERDSFSRD